MGFQIIREKKMKFSALFAIVTAGPQYDLSEVLTNLNNLNEWAADAKQMRYAAGAEITTEMQNWQDSYLRTAQFGGTRQQVRDLEQEGRRLILDQLTTFATTRGRYGDGISVKELSGYGCYGTPLGPFYNFESSIQFRH